VAGLSCTEYCRDGTKAVPARYTVTATFPKWKYIASIAHRCGDGGLPCILKSLRAYWKPQKRMLAYHLKCPQIALHKDTWSYKDRSNFLSRKFLSSTFPYEMYLISSTSHFVLHPSHNLAGKGVWPCKTNLCSVALNVCDLRKFMRTRRVQVEIPIGGSWIKAGGRHRPFRERADGPHERSGFLAFLHYSWSHGEFGVHLLKTVIHVVDFLTSWT
jgi:hypothetical protein